MEKFPPRRFRLKTGEEIEIREAAPQDAGALLDYVEAISAESDNLTFGPGEFALTLTQEQEYLAAMQKRSNSIYLVGFLGEELVSSLSFAGGLRRRMIHAGEFGMSVRKGHWNKGIGAAMLGAFLDWCRHTGEIRKVNLRVRVDNQAAIHLYTKFGFKLEGRRSREFYLGGEFKDIFLMGLEID
ncbi:MAG TPA: GNAT family protein [Limnochordia bacterium]|nr:GNAT family protein [Limnochordia bacterium]